MGIMKIFAFKVSPRNDWTASFEHAFRVANEKPLDKRLRELPSTRIRLEEVFFSQSGLIFANFVLFRTGSGPAIVSDSTRLSEIDIRDDQYFGEDTACLYDPTSSYILIQYNHHGPKASAIQQYLSYDEDDQNHSYVFAPKLSQSSEEKIRNLAVVSRVEVSFAVPDLLNYTNPRDLSFSQAIEVARINGAETVSLVIGNRRGLALQIVKDLIAGLQRTASVGEGITKLAIKAQVDDDTPRETIDLIADRLFTQVDVHLGAGRRYSVTDRWNTIKTTLDHWTKSGLLT